MFYFLSLFHLYTLVYIAYMCLLNHMLLHVLNSNILYHMVFLQHLQMLFYILLLHYLNMYLMLFYLLKQFHPYNFVDILFY